MSKVNLGAMEDDYAEHKREEEERKTKRAGKLRSTEGSQNGFFLCPPSVGSKDGRPYVRRGAHYKSGPENKRTMTCRRDAKKEPLEKCPQCVEVNDLFTSGQEKKIELGKSRQRKQKYIWGAVYLSQFIDKDGIMVPQKMWQVPPKCFGNYVGDKEKTGYKKCQNCVEDSLSWGPTCQRGICTFTQGESLYDPTYKAFKRFGDVTDIDSPRMMVIEQKNKDGSGREKYNVVDWPEFKFPEIVKPWVISNIIDLSTVWPPRSKEEMKAIMTGVEYEEDLASSELPGCFGDKKTYDAMSDVCKACEAFKSCTQEIKSEGGEKEEEEEEAEESGPVEIDLNTLDRSELKKLIASEELDIKVVKGWDDDRIRKEIAKAMGEKQSTIVSSEEEQEEPEEEEPEADEEVPMTDKFDAMDRDALKKYRKEKGYDFKVYLNTTDDDLRNKLRELEGVKTKESDEDEESELEIALRKQQERNKQNK